MENSNLELEQCILGFIILNHELVIDKGWLARIKSHFFSNSVNQKVFALIVDRIKNDYSLDSKIINFNEIFEKIEDGKEYLKVLINMGVGFVDFKSAIKELQELYVKREIEKINNNSKLKGDQLLIEIEKIKQEMIKEDRDTIQNIELTLANRIVEIETNKDNNNFLKTDFIDYDRNFAGLPKGQITLLAGSPSMGKSTLALQIAINVAKQGKNVLFFSQEMGQAEINNKIISNLYKIDNFRITCNNLFENEIEKLKKGELFNQIKTLDIDYSSSITADFVNRKIIEYKLKYKKDVDFVVIDHLHIMRDNKKSNNRNEELGNITSDIKGIAKEKNIPILLLSQLSRKDKNFTKTPNDYRPNLQDIRESGNIEANCDVIVFIHRAEYYLERDIQGLDNEDYETKKALLEASKGQTSLLVKKNRNGICTDIKIYFEAKYSRFSDIKGDQECNI